MNMRARQFYQTVQQETTVAVASPGELIILVYERILEHLRAADHTLAEGGDCGVSMTKALDLIDQGLAASLDFKNGGDVAIKLDSLYDWCMRSILRVRLGRDRALLAEVIGVLSSLLEGWVAISPSHNRRAA
jgi:flagellar protein FliS